ncbi:hypothetical protein AHiyo4_15430 [Arthrobacter sp. Hiyo4]|nr:hypothetical protein AHiyo4_15430 [Arthrobacter sp. Hiyo4]
MSAHDDSYCDPVLFKYSLPAANYACSARPAGSRLKIQGAGALPVLWEEWPCRSKNR